MANMVKEHHLLNRYAIHLFVFLLLASGFPPGSVWGKQPASEHPAGGFANPTPEAPTKPALKPSSSVYSVQIGAYLIKNNAVKMFANLRKRGYTPYIYQTKNKKGQSLYIVRLGDHPSIKEASFSAAQFRSLENMPVIITRGDSTVPLAFESAEESTGPGKAITALELSQISGGEKMEIGSEELSQIDGQTGTILRSNELAQIDGQTGTILPSDELAQIDGRTGTVMPSGELAQIDGRTGSVMQADELSNIDGRTGTVIPRDELANVDGRTGTVIESGELATVDGRAATVVGSGELGTIDGRAATVVGSRKLSTVDGQTGPSLDERGPQLSEPRTAPKDKTGADQQDPFFLAEDATGEDPFGAAGDEDLPVESGTVRRLKEKIEALEEKVNELREEADVRKILEITEEEKQEEEEEILSATGRDYTMAKKGSIGFDYGLSYTYNSFDALEDAASLTKIEHRSQHNLTNSLSITYALRDNVSFGASIPFIYKYDDQGTASPMEVTDLGDVALSLQWQPIKAGGDLPPGILSFSFALPSGRSPYEINPETELSTGSGTKSLSVGLSLSHPMDPVMVFGGLSFGYAWPIDNLNNQRYGDVLREVNQGQNIGIRAGLGYALSYKVNMNLNLSYSYGFGSEYIYLYSGRQPGRDSASASFSLGTSWRLSTKRVINISVAKGLTNDSSDFSIAFRVPFNF